jgi:hypothetical protein
MRTVNIIGIVLIIIGLIMIFGPIALFSPTDTSLENIISGIIFTITWIPGLLSVIVGIILYRMK